MTTSVTALPLGFTVRLHEKARSLDGGRLLVGGSPLRAIRLTDHASRMMPSDEVIVRDRASAALATHLLDANMAVPVLDDSPAAGTLTVVIPVRDRAEQLARALASIGTDVRTIVVDDASRTSQAVAAVAAQHGADLIVLDQNVGPAGARNAGLAEVRTPFVAFLDSDITVAPSALFRLARHFDDPRVSLVGPLVTGLIRSQAPRWFERYDERAGSLALGRVPSAVRPGAAVGWLPSACVVARVDHVRAVGGFAEDLRVGEDVDLVWRLVKADRVVRYDPDEVARHDVRATVRGWLGRKFLYGTGGARLGKRHGASVAPAVLSPVMAVAAASALSRRRWSPLVAGVAVAHGARAVARAMPGSPSHPTLAVDLALHGLGWAVRQETSLLLRHWWPATVVACVVSPSARRATASALLVDAAVGVAQHPKANPVATVAGRRLDDLAYGLGLWCGCVRDRDITALRPRWVMPHPRFRACAQRPRGLAGTAARRSP